MYCDFCGCAGPIWAHAARDFEMPAGPVVATSVGGWAACGPCHGLIVGRDWDGLVVRTAEAYSPGAGTDRFERVKMMVRKVHGLFREMRTGEWGEINQRGGEV